ncbi:MULTISPECIES: hypothetical protein [Paracoccus]|uniref:SRPBCC family protein n=1 Tax=Paracoccus litorisediminis TaxID=2006130 RepID=A0A844HV01_9RHOB|nr:MULTISPECIES: hypothetical protein [Paracoccus]MBD9529456.1 hypothetical protein [Paracoccus sp. PAR01]MTH62294.1 hypothetical protein [Paracoccus litorisediminis]
MKFSTREDTDISADELFAAVSDFPKIERLLLRKGAMVRRTGTNGTNAWTIGFDWRGKQRDVDLAVQSITPPERIELAGKSDMFELGVVMTVVALTPTKSRLIFEADVRPRGMKARLLLQTAKLSRAQIDRKFAQRIGDFVGRAATGQLS